jgi:hypothetical protein
VKYSKYFGAKRRGFIKSKSVLAPKGAIHLLNENIRYDTYFVILNGKISCIERSFAVDIMGIKIQHKF